MTKDKFENLLRSTGCDENSIRFGVNAFEMGMEHEREVCAEICENFADVDSYPDGIIQDYHAHLIRLRGKA